MGHFDVTCCITGLAIRGGDKVKFAAIAENGYESEALMSATFGEFSFVSPLLTGKYDNYGGVDNVVEKKLHKHIVKRLNAINVGEETFSFQHTMRTIKLSCNKAGHHTRLFMMHEWAFHWLLSRLPNDVLRDSAGFAAGFMSPYTIPVDCMHDAAQCLKDCKDAATKELLQNALTDTLAFSTAFLLLRKPLLPVQAVGMQFEDYQLLGPFLATVAARAEALKKKCADDDE